jgi:arylsulfatase A-like enzyme
MSAPATPPSAPPPRASTGRQVADVVLSAAAFALIGGLLHAAVSWVRRDVLRDLLRTWMSPDTSWMAPLGYLVLFLGAAIPVVLVVSLVRRLPALRLSVFIFGTLAAFSFVLLFPRLHQYAALALGLGIGAQLASAAGRRVEAWRRRLGQVVVAGGLLTVALWSYQTGERFVHERRALAALPSAPADAPNVLLLILDTVRASSLSLYGAERATTPRLDAFARGGTTFDWAFSTAPWTLPSHASMFTGRYSSQQTGNWTTPLDGAHATLAGVLASYGYATGGFTANLVATPRGFGLDRGFSRYEDHRRSLAQMLFTTSLGQANSIRNSWDALVRQRWIGQALRSLARFDFEPRYSYPDNDPKSAELITASFLRWRDGVEGRPYFAFLNFFDAHGPYESPARYDTLFGRSDRVRDKYDRSIRYLDDALASLFDSLKARGELDRTIIVIASDHGEQFGEHGLGWHSNSLYEQLTHVPLFIRYPARVPAGARVSQPVSLRDLAATLVDLGGLADGRGLGGTSLAPTWADSAARTSAAIAELSRGINAEPSALNAKGDMYALADDSLHFIRNGDGSYEIYAYRRDPREEVNLGKGPHAALTPAFDSFVTRMLAAPPAAASASRRP